MALTTLEQQALDALRIESAANGHDFGLVECVDWDNRMQLGGLITQLRVKGVITEIAPVQTDDETWTQFVIAKQYQ